MPMMDKSKMKKNMKSKYGKKAKPANMVNKPKADKPKGY